MKLLLGMRGSSGDSSGFCCIKRIGMHLNIFPDRSAPPTKHDVTVPSTTALM